MAAVRRYPLARPLSDPVEPGSRPLDEFASAAGLHPQLVRRFVALGLLTPVADAAGRWWFPASQLVRVARIQRLRADLALNYAAVGVVLDLLARIEELESALRAAQRSTEGVVWWTRTG